MRIPSVVELLEEVNQHYPEEPVNAMTYVMEKYNVEHEVATHLVSMIWGYLDMKYPLNLPYFLFNPYGIHKN